MTTYIPRLKKLYQKNIVSSIIKEHKLPNKMMVPKLTKVVLNMGLGDAVNDRKVLQNAANDMGLIAGQKPVVTKAKKSIATFKIRQGMPIGMMVTLRSDRMYEFIDRLITIALPRVRDFRGLSPKSFDGNGNYSFGIREQIIFPEINYDNVDQIRGMQIVVCTSADDDDLAASLLKKLNFPLS